MADPVCVNNHREYINSCQMEVLTCQDGIEKNVITEGHCPPEPCDSRGKHAHYGSTGLGVFKKGVQN